MKTLVIEDTLTSAALVCHQLGKMGLEAVHARDGEAGIEAFKSERPDLVLLDIVMPGMDGFEVARRIRQLESDGDWTPIIFFSARTSDEDLERAIEAGGDDYLVKPVSGMVLKAKVRAMQRIARMRSSLLVLTRKLDEANRELARLSSVDGLTGIANRRCFDETLMREWRRCARNGKALSLLLIDVDFFKPFNDSYGHQAGDECLKAIACALSRKLNRSPDLVARYGGEEFGVILPDTEKNGALAVAETLRDAVQALDIPHCFPEASPTVTISIGLASSIPPRGGNIGFIPLLQQADAALYRAKTGGRNRVECAPEECLVGVCG